MGGFWSLCVLISDLSYLPTTLLSTSSTVSIATPSTFCHGCLYTWGDALTSLSPFKCHHVGSLVRDPLPSGQLLSQLPSMLPPLLDAISISDSQTTVGDTVEQMTTRF